MASVRRLWTALPAGTGRAGWWDISTIAQQLQAQPSGRTPSPSPLALVSSFPNHWSCHPTFPGPETCLPAACMAQAAFPFPRKQSSYLRLRPMRFWMNFWTWAFPLILLYSLVNSPSECLWDLRQGKYSTKAAPPSHVMWDLSQDTEISLFPLSRSPLSLLFSSSVSFHLGHLLDETSAQAGPGAGGSSALWACPSLLGCHLLLETSMPQKGGLGWSLPLLEAHQVFD